MSLAIHLLVGGSTIGLLVLLTGGGGPGSKDCGQRIAVIGCEGRTREKVEQAIGSINKIDGQGDARMFVFTIKATLRA